MKRTGSFLDNAKSKRNNVLNHEESKSIDYLTILNKQNKIFTAINEGRFQLAIEMLKNFDDFNFKDQNGNSLFNASMAKYYQSPNKESFDFIIILINLGVKVDLVYNENLNFERSHLNKSLVNKDYNLINLLLSINIDVNHNDSSGITPLITAILKRDEHLVKLLLDKGANPNLKERYGNTPLIVAISMGNPQIVNYLLKSGANIEQKDINGFTPLCYAAKYGSLEINKLLIDNGAKIENISNYETPLMLASSYNSDDVVQLLIDNGAEIDKVNEEKNTALMLTLFNRNYKNAQTLIKNGADVNIKNKYGRRPINFMQYNEDIFFNNKLNTEPLKQREFIKLSR
jgi:ankyrin repeat protein